MYDERRLDDAVESFDGRRSRSFRLTESLIRLQSEALLQAFTQYWQNQKFDGSQEKGSQGFLILTEFTLQPRRRAPELQTERKDTVIWISSQ